MVCVRVGGVQAKEEEEKVQKKGGSIFWKQIPMKSSVQWQRGGLEERGWSLSDSDEEREENPTTSSSSSRKTTILLSKLLQPQLIPLWPPFHWAKALYCANEAIQQPVPSWWQPQEKASQRRETLGVVERREAVGASVVGLKMFTLEFRGWGWKVAVGFFPLSTV